MKKNMLILFVSFLALMVCAEVTITNLLVSQRPGTKLVDITYDVASTETNVVAVSLSISSGSRDILVSNVSGDVGAGVATGNSKAIVWDTEGERVFSMETLSFSVVAEDGVVPAGGDSSAISWEEINDRWVKNIYANGDITMSDRHTENMWAYNATASGKKKWADAITYCANLTYAGYSDWGLPWGRFHWESDRGPLYDVLFNENEFFLNALEHYFWTSYSEKSYFALAGYKGRDMSSWGEKAMVLKENHYAWPMREQQ